MTITTICAGLAKTKIGHGHEGQIYRRDNGKWSARPDWEAFTVGKFWPQFNTRREAAEWLWETYGSGS